MQPAPSHGYHAGPGAGASVLSQWVTSVPQFPPLSNGEEDLGLNGF